MAAAKKFYYKQPDYLVQLNDMNDTFEAALANALGPQGWSPALVVASDGERRVLRVIDWIGGDGDKPTITGYLGVSSIVPLIADAVDVRGAAGANGKGIVSVVRTSGTGAPGTTDTYTITYTDATTNTFTVYNGADGSGGGVSSWNDLEDVPLVLENINAPATITGLAITPTWAGVISILGGATPKNISSNLYTRTGISTNTGKWVEIVNVTGYNPGTTAINLGDIEAITSSLVFSGTSSVSSFTAANLRFANGLTLGTLGRLSTINLPELIVISAGSAFITSIQLNLPKLEYLGGSTSFDVAGINFPELLHAPLCNTLCTYTGGAVTVSVPKLQTIGSISVSGAVQWATHSYPALKTCFNSITISGTNATSLSVPALEVVGIGVGNFNQNVNITATNITSLSFPSLKQVGQNGLNQSFTVTSPINQASVDGILVKLASLDGTNGYQSFDTRTVNLNGTSTAVPSATGLAAKTTLEARGCTVNVKS